MQHGLRWCLVMEIHSYGPWPAQVRLEHALECMTREWYRDSARQLLETALPYHTIHSLWPSDHNSIRFMNMRTTHTIGALSCATLFAPILAQGNYDNMAQNPYHLLTKWLCQ
jgi:hypothetical protein